VNKKPVSRLYCEEDPGIRRRKPRRWKSVHVREARPPTGQTNESWNQHWFLSLDEARAVTEAWREDYNRVRPHGALGNRTPSEFARPVDGHAQLPALHGQQIGWYQVGGSVSPRPDEGPCPAAPISLHAAEILRGQAGIADEDGELSGR
jgi:putative transposase